MYTMIHPVMYKAKICMCVCVCVCARKRHKGYTHVHVIIASIIIYTHFNTQFIHRKLHCTYIVYMHIPPRPVFPVSAAPVWL